VISKAFFTISGLAVENSQKHDKKALESFIKFHPVEAKVCFVTGQQKPKEYSASIVWYIQSLLVQCTIWHGPLKLSIFSRKIGRFASISSKNQAIWWVAGAQPGRG